MTASSIGLRVGLNPFEIRAGLKRALHRKGDLISLNPFEIRAGLKLKMIDHKDILAVS